MKVYTVNYLYFLSTKDNVFNADEVDGYCLGVFTSDAEAEKAVKRKQYEDEIDFDDCHFTLTELLGGYKMEKGNSFIRCWIEQKEINQIET